MTNLAFENLVIRLLLLIVAILRRHAATVETREEKQDRDQLCNGRAIAFLNDPKRREPKPTGYVGTTTGGVQKT